MKLTKLGCIAVITAVMGLTSVAQAAGHGCKGGEVWSPKEKMCVAGHGCKDKEHWDVKLKKCAA